MSIGGLLAAAGAGAGIAGLVAVVIVAAVAVGSIPLLLAGMAGWKSVSREFPEAREFRHLGLVSFFTMGLPLVGVWPYLALHRDTLHREPELAKWLGRPVTLWLWTFVALLAGDLLCTTRLHLIPLVVSQVCLAVSVVLLVVSGLRSSQELHRAAARSSIRAWAFVLVGGALFVAMSLGSHTPGRSSHAIGGLIAYVLCLFSAYHFVRQLLMMLLAATTVSPDRRAHLAAPLSGLGVLVWVLPLVALLIGSVVQLIGAFVLH